MHLNSRHHRVVHPLLLCAFKNLFSRCSLANLCTEIRGMSTVATNLRGAPIMVLVATNHPTLVLDAIIGNGFVVGVEVLDAIMSTGVVVPM